MRIHRPVLLQESIELLNCAAGGFYVDCTLGMGGHSEKILEESSPDGRLLGIDRDPEAIEYSRKRLARYGDRVELIHGDYRMLNTFLISHNAPSPNGVLADLGPSLLQFTQPERGFSFMQDGPLDMRMDPSSGETAAEILNTASALELKELIRKFGEEKAASRIAEKISDSRRKAPLRTTGELRKLIEEVLPVRRDQKIHPATRTFQALRIAVNRELEDLDTFVFDAFDSLAPGGRLVIIAFHSLEDRIIKQTFKFLSATCRCPKALMVCLCGGKPLSRLITRKAIRPSKREQDENPASRSARLRSIEKLASPAPRSLWKTWQNEHE